MDTIVVGAGVAGLSCARTLHAAGRAPVVLEKARGVGGRCATRRLGDQPADHGPVFLHGSDAGFLADLDEVDATALAWPSEVSGSGPPCHPGSLRPTERRVAFDRGLTAFPKHLARGLDVRLQVRVERLRPSEGGTVLHLGDAGALHARTVVLTPPAEQTLTLLGSAGMDLPALNAARAVLGRVRCVPTLALVAHYGTGAEAPPWDVLLPEDSDVLQVVAHDSAKRGASATPALVLQARPAWSAVHLEDDPAAWSAALLDEAARVVGPWAGDPIRTHPHRWRYARVDRAALLPAPIVVDLPSGGRLALAGELFDRGGGVEGAWRSGRHLAQRLLESS